MYDTDIDLETRIREAAPCVAPPVGLGEHRARIIREAQSRSDRRMGVWGASVAASALLIGGGSVAVAGTGNETPWGWVADNIFAIDRTDGAACFQGILVKWDGLSEDDPMVVDAKAIVAGIDLEALDTTAVEDELRAEYAQSTGENGQPLPVVLSPAQLKLDAIHQIVASELFSTLNQRGYEMSPGHEVSLSSQTTDCR